MKTKIIIPFLILIFGFTSSCMKEDINPAEGIPNPIAALPVVHQVYKGEPLPLGPERLSGAKFTQGYVISDQESGNIPSNQVVIEYNWRGLNRGLVLFLEDNLASTFSTGDFLQLDLTNTTIERVNGTLGISGLTQNKIEKLEDPKELEAASVDIARLKANFSNFENTLVMVTADLIEFPEGGTTLAGRNYIIDGSGDSIAIYTDPSADFSDVRLAPSAGFRGIAYQGNDGIEIRLRNANDLIDPSGPIYSGYPEDFEFPDAGEKASYNMPAIDNLVTLATGEWRLFYAILGDIANRDRYVSGSQAVRMQQNLNFPIFLEMNYDLPNGASKVTFWYGSYFNDQSCTFQLEYSVDQGETWEIIGEPITDAHTFATSPIAKQASFLVDIQEPVRFRINKLGLGPSNGSTVRNGRLGIDDFAVYQSY
ncbi:DUF5689 domain-containing protein [Belliella marina]|uniref:DUF5689 domain-containing protein n=1 Tax=Belliella marina TaxID=1644146 RepID=A0ABW4VPP2_9BACT